MPSITPAIWAAIAASFSALSSFLVMLIQRQNLLEAARPELILTDWSRSSGGSGESAHDIISFQTSNIGHGAALNLLIRSPMPVKLEKTEFMVMDCVPILPAGKNHEAKGHVVVRWQDIQAMPHTQSKMVVTKIQLVCRDSRGRRHVTTYTILVNERPHDVSKLIPPDMQIMSRRTTTAGVLWLKLIKTLTRLGFPVPNSWYWPEQ